VLRILLTLTLAVTLAPSAASTATAPPAPTNVRATVLTGPRIELTWDLPPPTAGIRSWVVYRNGIAIGTSNTIAFTDTRISGGGPFVYVVQAVDAAGTAGALSTPLSVSLGGAPSPAPSPLPPPLVRPLTLVAQPQIAGRARRGSVLVAKPARWSAAGPLRISHQWLRCRRNGACANIAGATQRRYRVRRFDVGFRLRVVENARNAAGTGSAASRPTSVVR
jgi:hypothetical protein